MDEDITPGSFLFNIGFMLTYKCTIACPHCIVEAGPHRKKVMRMDRALSWIEQAAKYNNGYIKACALTGGEVFHDIDTLRTLSDYAHSLGFVVSAVTNGFWATSKRTAINLLKTLPSIHLLCVSTDAYHQRFIPLANIRNSIEALKDLGLTYSIAVCKDAEDTQQFRDLMCHLKDFADEDKIVTSKTFPVGRARHHLSQEGFPMVAEPSRAACTMASSPVVFPDGQVVGCIGPAITIQSPHKLLLGDLKTESLEEILQRAETNAILHTIRVWGPYRILEWLNRIGCSEKMPSSYMKDCTCDVCYKLLSDERLQPYIELLANNEEFAERTKYGRLYHLGEEEVLQPLESQHFLT
ncbi:MAG TPA: radical SAM protein [Dissulfurispiraceae bacterium]|nr:radical SAM protein [Dissulfurispiraceae bacterium]